MKTLTTFAASSMLAVAAAQAARVDGVVQWDIEKRDIPDGKPLRRRDGKVGATYEEVITNEKLRGGYFATTQVGTPGQKLTLQLDTGSSDIWVPYSGSEVCTTTSRTSAGCTFGSCKWSGMRCPRRRKVRGSMRCSFANSFAFFPQTTTKAPRRS